MKQETCFESSVGLMSLAVTASVGYHSFLLLRRNHSQVMSLKGLRLYNNYVSYKVASHASQSASHAVIES